MRSFLRFRHVAALPRTQAPLHRTSFGLQIGKKESLLGAAVFEIGCLPRAFLYMFKEHEGHQVCLGVYSNQSMRQFHHCRLLIAVMWRIRIIFPDQLHGACGLRYSFDAGAIFLLGAVLFDRSGSNVKSCLILKGAFIKGRGAEIFSEFRLLHILLVH